MSIASLPGRLGIAVAALSLSLAPTALGGVAAADEIRVPLGPPLFFPSAEFRREDGYYRTREGRYYHYDRNRDGWHYGRDHREGERYERRHSRR